MIPVALAISGSDSGGGAGVQADPKTLAAFGVFGASAITALTAQNTTGVRAIANLEPDFVASQIDAVCDDFAVAAVKTGMLSRAAIVERVAERIAARKLTNVVVDPVIVAASGDVLLEGDAIATIKSKLFPQAALITPNIREASILCGVSVRNVDEVREAARLLVRIGAPAALVTGGALGDSGSGDALDVFFDGKNLREFREKRVAIGKPAHGAGCTLSSAIAAGLARGQSLEDSIAIAKRFVTWALETSPAIGNGARPLNHQIGAFPSLKED